MSKTSCGAKLDCVEDPLRCNGSLSSSAPFNEWAPRTLIFYIEQLNRDSLAFRRELLVCPHRDNVAEGTSIEKVEHFNAALSRDLASHKHAGPD